MTRWDSMREDERVSSSVGESSADFAQAACELAEARGVVPTLRAVVDNAVALLECDWAAVAATEHLGAHPAKFSATNDDRIAGVIADVAGAAGDSPGIRAYQTGLVVVCNDLTSDDRFPDYTAALVKQTPIRAVLSIPLRMHNTSLGVLSCYSRRPAAFNDAAVEDARVLAVHAVVAVAAAQDELRADNLEIALLSSRTTGAAVGILVERYKLRTEEAFALLSRASQNANRPLATLAAELVESGTIAGLEGVDR